MSKPTAFHTLVDGGSGVLSQWLSISTTKYLGWMLATLLSIPLVVKVYEQIFSILAFLRMTVQDFRQQKFYNPWGREHPVIITDRQQMDELSSADELSQPAVYGDIFGFKYTMQIEEDNCDPLDKVQSRFRLFARCIRVVGTSQLPDLHPFLQAEIEAIMTAGVQSGVDRDGWASIGLAPLTRNVTSKPLALYIYGKQLNDDPEFVQALGRYYEDTMSYAGLLQVTPSWMQSMLHSLITNHGKAAKTLISHLRRAVISCQNEPNPRHKHRLDALSLLHNLVEMSKGSSYWTTNVLVQALIGFWIAGGHQPWINLHFAILELCERKEYVELLRDEIERQEELNYKTIAAMPILDSFLKESIRVNPLDSKAVRRKALKPYTFSKGAPHIQRDEVICVSSYDLMHDAQKYPRPSDFDGLRFVKNLPSTLDYKASDSPMRGTPVTEVSKDFPIWGYGSNVCPGRYHASFVLKLIIIHFVSKYDFRLERQEEPWKWFWDSFQLPYDSTRILIRDRRT